MDPMNAMDNLWRSQPTMIRRFLELRPRYEKLSEEVAYIVDKCVQGQEIEYAAVTHRVKTLESFCEKVLRKAYEKPLEETTDVAGVRVVYLYPSDRARLEAVVEKQFILVEKVDKIEKDDVERFGYGAIHYLVKLGKKSSGARYDDLKDLVCEIQVRTILQDAWALVAHHLSYKKESDVPPELRRKLNALSGLFETADDQFDRLRAERTEYAEKVKEEISSGTDASLHRALNLDNLMEFLKWRFPGRRETSREEGADLLRDLKSLGCKTLADVENALSRAESAFIAYEKKYPPRDSDTMKPGRYACVGVVRVAFRFVSPEYRERLTGRISRKRIEEFDHLVQLPKKAERKDAKRRRKTRRR